MFQPLTDACRDRRQRRDDRGDTLIEIVVALLIISISVVALLGGLVTSITSSSAHRNLTSLDGVLRSLASNAKFAVETNPADGTAGPLFKRCASGYPVSGSLYPGTQLIGGPVSVPVIGLKSAWPLSVTVGGTPATVTAGGTTSSASGQLTGGAAVVTFTVPAVGTGNQPVIVSDGTTALAAGILSVTNTGTVVEDLLNSGTGSTLYTLNTSMSYWDGTGFNLTLAQCQTNNNNADLQQMTLHLADTQVATGGGDSLSVGFANLKPLAVPIETIGGSGTFALGSNVSLVSTVSGSSGTPTGSVTWSFPSAPGGTGCSGSNTTSLAGGTTTCNLPNAQAGSYTPIGTYTGDAIYSGTSSDVDSSGNPATVTVNQGTVAVTTSTTTPSPAANGSTLNFSASVTWSAPTVAPTGTITWTFSGAPLGAACQGGNTMPVATTVNCTVTTALPGTYNPKATFNSADTNYPSGAWGSQASVTVSATKLSSTTTVTGSPSSPATLASNLTFTATVTGATTTPTGTVTWTFPAGTPAGTTCSNLTNNSGSLTNGSGTCTVSNAAAGSYNPTATYSGDFVYASSQSNQSTIIVNQDTPGITVIGALSGNGKNKTVTFTATIKPPSAGEPTPTGTVSWTVVAGGGPANCTASSLAPGSGNTAVATCQISSPNSQLQYTATASYSGDNNYVTVSKTSQPVQG